MREKKFEGLKCSYTVPLNLDSLDGGCSKTAGAYLPPARQHTIIIIPVVSHVIGCLDCTDHLKL